MSSDTALTDCLAVLDVGHGSCAVLLDSDGVVVIDAGPGSTLLEFLLEQGVSHVHVVLISHADEDHIAGLVALVACDDIQIDCVRVSHLRQSRRLPM